MKIIDIRRSIVRTFRVSRHRLAAIVRNTAKATLETGIVFREAAKPMLAQATNSEWLRSLFSWLLPDEKPDREYPPAPGGTVIYAVGDIHGRFDLLMRLCKRIEQDAREESPKKPVEIYLGDYVDRGPDSAKVIGWLLERKTKRNVVLLRGNHEHILESFLDKSTDFREWRQLGGLETLASYGVDPEILQDPRDDEEVRSAFAANFPPAHRQFLAELLVTFELGGYFFVHAGVRPDIPLQEQIEKDCLWIRDEFLGNESDFGRIIVHGHSPVETPEFLPNRINLDTAAYATGQLSCLKISQHGASLLEEIDP